MKRLIAFVLTLTILMLLVSCQKEQPQGTVLKARSGEFSEKELKSAIKKYQSNYTNIVLEKAVHPVFLLKRILKFHRAWSLVYPESMIRTLRLNYAVISTCLLRPNARTKQ